MSAVEDIRIKLENRLILCEQEIESLRTALDALDDQQASGDGAGEPARETAPASRPGGGRPRAASDGARRSARTRSKRSSAELERLLAETGGLSAVELARQTGTDYGEVLARIRQLEQAGQPRS